MGRGHTFAAPAVYDVGCGRYFAALSPPGGSGDPALVTWTDADPMASLDGAVSGGTTRLPDGLAALVPVGGGATVGGGVFAVDGAGSVRWFGPDARKLAASAAAAAGAGLSQKKSAGGKKKQAEQQQHQKRIVETASAVDGDCGVLVVTVDSARGATGNGRIATLYRAVGGEHSGRSVEVVWEVEVGVPEEAAAAANGGAPTRVVAAAASDDELVILWSRGLWAAYVPRGSNPGTPTRSLTLAGGESAAATTPTKSGAKKRSAQASASNAEVNAAGAATLPVATCVPLGGGYYAVAQVGSGCGGGARVCVIDTRYGAVHSSIETHPGTAGGLGSDLGVQLAVLREDDVNGGGGGGGGSAGAYRVVVVIPGEVVLSEVPAPPPLSLAAALGALSTGGAGPAGAGVAAERVLGAEGVAACSKPPQHGVMEPKLPLNSVMSSVESEGGRGGAAGGGSMVDMGDPTSSKWWGGGDGGKGEKAARDAIALFEGDAPVKATAAASALKPFLSGSSTLPPAVLTAAVEGCVRRNQWEPIQGLVAGGHVPSSAAAPELVAALIAGDRLTDVEAFLGSAREVSAADVRRCLHAFLLGDGKAAGPSMAAMGAVTARQRAAAETAVRAAESFSATATTTINAKKKKHGGAAAVEARLALHRARIAVAAVEDFASMPWAAPLHALVARPIDPSTAAEALPGLPAAAAVKLIAYLSTWLNAYSGGGASSVDLSARPPKYLPSIASVVSWASAVIDAHFTTFAMGAGGDEEDDEGDGGDRAAMASLRAAAAKLQAACASVGKVAGALQHMREGAPLPEHQGMLSTTYTIELVDW